MHAQAYILLACLLYIVGRFGYAEVIRCLNKNIVILLFRWHGIFGSIDLVHGLSSRSILHSFGCGGGVATIGANDHSVFFQAHGWPYSLDI